MAKENKRTNDEQWLPVVGFEGWYDVSNFGRIRRMRDGGGSFVGKILKPYKNSWSYLQVALHVEGDRAERLVHRLVIAAFIGPCPEGKEVNHIDGVRTNNYLNNLEYVTHSENAIHAHMIGLNSNQGETHPLSKLTEDDVHKIRGLLRDGVTQTSIGEIFNVSQVTISNIARGVVWAWLK